MEGEVGQRINTNNYIKVNNYINCGYLPIFFLYSLKSVNEIRLKSDMNINKLKFIKYDRKTEKLCREE